ncbi:MAG TPA: hypothetical protein VMR50_07265 [Myxococcota bacterium]|nr:hypothetical protein [Myxococcota bacterium]
MNPEVQLCEHLRARDPASLRIEPDDIFDWSDGPVTAIARCARCPQLGVLELLDWSRSRRVRIFALSGLEPEPLALYRRDVTRGSCDPARLAQETAALFAAAGPVERIVAIELERNAVLGSVVPAPDFRFPPAPWPQRQPGRDDDSWFAELGLDKSGA